MNASYRLNTCKSRGSIFLAIEKMATGARVSNAYPTCRLLWDSLLKRRLIPYGILIIPVIKIKDLSVNDGDAFH